MNKAKIFLGGAGLLAATTLGAGIFSLPYVFEESGWLLGFFYLGILSAFIIFTHRLYWRALEKVQKREGLLGLVNNYLGKNYFWLAFFIIILGLILILVAYLILAGKFISFIFGETAVSGIIVFWFISSLPLIFKLPRLVGLEFLGGVLMVGLIFLIFGTSGQMWQLPAVVNPHNFFLPFGSVLFSLAGWTAIEPMYDWIKKKNGFDSRGVLISGTLIVALLYLIFVLGIWASAGRITADAISGLGNWPFWKLMILSWLGILAIWTSYLPISLEVKNSLEKDLNWRPSITLAIVLFSPLILLAAGLRDFLNVISLVGGIFLSLQYVFIILVSRKILDLSRGRRILADFLILIFSLAAVYEIYYFVR